MGYLKGFIYFLQIVFKITFLMVYNIDETPKCLLLAQGRPFMESIMDNRPLFLSVCFSIGGIGILLTGIVPEFSEQFQIVQFPEEVRGR